MKDIMYTNFEKYFLDIKKHSLAEHKYKNVHYPKAMQFGIICEITGNEFILGYNSIRRFIDKFRNRKMQDVDYVLLILMSDLWDNSKLNLLIDYLDGKLSNSEHGLKKYYSKLLDDFFDLHERKKKLDAFK